LHAIAGALLLELTVMPTALDVLAASVVDPL
jgi:hypothetical protein